VLRIILRPISWTIIFLTLCGILYLFDHLGRKQRIHHEAAKNLSSLVPQEDNPVSVPVTQEKKSKWLMTIDTEFTMGHSVREDIDETLFVKYLTELT